VTEEELRRHLNEAHRQMLERDNAYRFYEEELSRRDREIEQLREQLAETQAWAKELETDLQEMQETRAWRLAVNLRSLQERAAKLTGR
jgi:hypothetical protein